MVVNETISCLRATFGTLWHSGSKWRLWNPVCFITDYTVRILTDNHVLLCHNFNRYFNNAWIQDHFRKKILWKKHHSIFPYRSSQRSYLSTEKVTLNNKNKLIVIIFYCGNRMYAFSIDSSTWRSIKYKFLKIPKLWLNWGKSSFSPEVAQFTGHELFLPTYMSISSTQ